VLNCHETTGYMGNILKKIAVGVRGTVPPKMSHVSMELFILSSLLQSWNCINIKLRWTEYLCIDL